jgi:hypothetical protein
VPDFALFDQLEVKREHGEITATRAPRRMVGGDLFLCKTFAFRVGRSRKNVAARNRNISE